MGFFKRSVVSIVVCACVLAKAGSGWPGEPESPLFWPPPPAEARISFVRSLYVASDLGIKPGFFKKLKRMLSGGDTVILNKPMAVAVGRENTMYVCDTGIPAVHIFMPKEERYKKITSIDNEDLISPVSVALSGQGQVFIADSQLKKVFCLDAQGNYKFTVGGKREFLRPTGLAVSNQRLYVADTLAHRVFVFDLGGNFIVSFGGRGNKQGQFNFPSSICADGQGRVYIVDSLNFRIQVFDENNAFLFSIGQLGDSSGFFSRPKGVAVDSFGHVYVSDGLFDNIQVFNQQKEFLLSWGESGYKDGEFWMPSGIAIDADNYIYVADSYNQRIQVFYYMGND